MKFGSVPVREAAGAILAHSAQARGPDGQIYKIAKGTDLTEDAVRDLAAQGVAQVSVATPEPGDVAENPAADRLAVALLSGTEGLRATPPGTGRVNLRAIGPGLAQIDAGAIDAVNAVDPGITVATVPPLHRLDANGLAATVKIIPYAVSEVALEAACAAARGATGLLLPKVQLASLVETQVPGQTLSAKGRDAIRLRLARLGAGLSPRIVVPHAPAAIAAALSAAPGELVMILTGSATSDVQDTAPEALRAAGGTVAHYGMPVDPGNLLFIGRLHGRVVIGLPGCARSPALNGADWVLERALCGLPPGRAEIMAMGVGGLLKDIPSRPLTRRKSETG